MKSSLFKQADAALAADRHADALAIYLQLLAKANAASPAEERLYVNAGACLRALSRQDEAIRLLKQGLEAYPFSPSLHNNLANNLADTQGERWQILQHYLRAHQLGQQRQGTTSAVAYLLKELHFPLTAYQLLHRWWQDQAQTEPPTTDTVRVLLELALSLFEDDDLEAVSSWCLERLQASSAPSTIPEQLALMVTYARRGEVARALAIHREVGEAIARNGNSGEESQMYVNSSWNLAIQLLGQGQMQPGWKLFEYGLQTPCKGPQRWQRALTKLFSAQQVPLWRGETLPSGTRLLLMAEQAVGDTMMFLQLLPELLHRELALTLVVQPRLHPIYARSFPELTVVSSDEAEQSLDPAAFDLQCPVGSLPQYLLAGWVEHGSPQTHLSVDVKLKARLRRDYRRGLGRGKPLIGISWSGGGKRERIRVKSVGVERMAELMGRVDARFVSLQYGNCARQIEAWQRQGIDIVDPSEINALHDMDSWLAQVAACDLVISVANTTIHGAALVGVPTFCLLSRSPDWRWTRRDDEGSYWYDAVDVARQARGGSWTTALDEAVEWVTAKRATRYAVDHGAAQARAQVLSFQEWLA